MALTSTADTSPVALVTGVSRRVGIGAAVARRLAADGWRLRLTGLPRYDEAQPYGGDPDGVPALVDELAGRATYQEADLLDAATPAALVSQTVRQYGRIDAVVAAHAYGTGQRFGSLDAEEIDRHLQVNVRASLLLAEAFAAAFTADAGGRLVLFSSGQRLGPMPHQLAYAVSKAAVENLAYQLSPLLIRQEITVNCVHPGPTDTGYASAEAYARVAAQFPSGRWGTPDDAARLVAWLCSPDAAWITGQVIDSEGGFNRYQ